MTQEEFEREDAIHRQIYEELKDTIKRDYADQYVGIAKGRLIAVSPSHDEVLAAIEKLQPTPEYFLLFRGDMDPGFEVIDSFNSGRWYE